MIRCVSRIYVLNSIHRVSRFPPLAQWLLYVNLAPTEMRALLERVRTIQELAALNDKQVNHFLTGYSSFLVSSAFFFQCSITIRDCTLWNSVFILFGLSAFNLLLDC